jgi:hypothetical protein
VCTFGNPCEVRRSYPYVFFTNYFASVASHAHPTIMGGLRLQIILTPTVFSFARILLSLAKTPMTSFAITAM